MKKILLLLSTIILLIILLPSCQTVKPYQRVYLNDHFMRLSARQVDHFGEKVHAYREGASGGGTGKASGGCGCN
jgi:hypothetical protein